MYRIMLRLLYFSNTTVNFFVYILRYKDFREALKKQLPCMRTNSYTRDSMGVRSPSVFHVASALEVTTAEKRIPSIGELGGNSNSIEIKFD